MNDKKTKDALKTQSDHSDSEDSELSGNNPTFECCRQQEVLVSKGRYITFTLPEICLLLKCVMTQQGDESVVTCEELDWNLIASQLDKDPFEVEYFWEKFNPNQHFKPTLGFAIVPFSPPASAIEQKLIASNSDAQSNYERNLNILNEYKLQQSAKRDEEVLGSFCEFTRNRIEIFQKITNNN
ncbi:hypothetical protein FG386_002853 [Cryptosporidium ryanae]|uniref:uncharacterized protein n=1 Tax=Cryptosporidium ryanae TaxID=515981 RepID=UPI003519E75E|nr:hypothetical protein FG386_002853 [Cryptosporidium ryanae]